MFKRWFAAGAHEADELARLRAERVDDKARIAVLEERVKWLERIESEYLCELEKKRVENAALFERLLFLSNTDRREEKKGQKPAAIDDSPTNISDWQADAQRESAAMDRRVARSRLSLTIEEPQEELANAN